MFNLQTTDAEGEAGGVVRLEYWKEQSKLVVGYRAGVVAVWDTRLGTLLTVVRVSPSELTHMQLVPSQALLLTSSVDGELAVWSLSH